MPWIAGTATRIYSWVNDAAAAINITASRMDGDSDDFVSMINDTLLKSGDNAPSANLPMANFRHTGVGNAAARTDYAAAGQIQDGGLIFGTTAGTANAQTLAPAPAITAYAAGQKFRFKIGAALTNTAAVTLAISGLASPKNVTNIYGGALAPGAWVAGAIVEVIYDGTSFIDVGGYGAPILLFRTAASASGTIDFVFPAGYAGFLFRWYNVVLSTNTAGLNCRVAIAGSFQATGAYDIDDLQLSNGALTDTFSSGATSIPLCPGQDTAATTFGLQGHAELFGYAGTALNKIIEAEASVKAANFTKQWTNGRWTGAQSALSDFRFLPTAGTITSGTFDMLGVR